MTPIQELRPLKLPAALESSPDVPNNLLFNVQRTLSEWTDIIERSGEPNDEQVAKWLKEKGNNFLDFWALLVNGCKKAQEGIEGVKCEYSQTELPGALDNKNILRIWHVVFQAGEAVDMYITTPLEEEHFPWVQIEIRYENRDSYAGLTGTGVEGSTNWSPIITVAGKPTNMTTPAAYTIKFNNGRLREIGRKDPDTEYSTNKGLSESQEKKPGGTKVLTFDWRKFDQAQAQVAPEAQS